MGSLDPIAFDIETSGFDESAVVTVAGFAHELDRWLVLNTGGRDADPEKIREAVEPARSKPLTIAVRQDECELLEAVDSFVADRLDGDRHYLTAYNGERWDGGFDLPFLRRACLRNDVRFPFGDLAYADTMDAVDRFDTAGRSDLDSVYELLVGGEHGDPFDDSAAAVAAFEAGDWVPLLRHNLADVERTLELIRLAGRFVPQSDFGMKSLEPPRR